jgi:hypothetical protein
MRLIYCYVNECEIWISVKIFENFFLIDFQWIRSISWISVPRVFTGNSTKIWKWNPHCLNSFRQIKFVLSFKPDKIRLLLIFSFTFINFPCSQIYKNDRSRPDVNDIFPLLHTLLIAFGFTEVFNRSNFTIARVQVPWTNTWLLLNSIPVFLIRFCRIVSCLFHLNLYFIRMGFPVLREKSALLYF